MRFISFLFAIFLLILNTLMLYLRQEPSEAMWVVYEPSNSGLGSLKLSIDRTAVPRPLYDTPIRHPVWSSDGQSIAYVADSSIYRAQFRDGHIQNPQAVFSPLSPDMVFNITNLIWSADSQQLAFILDESIYTIDADGTELRYLANVSVSSGQTIAWSPNGQWIVYSNQRQLYRINADGTWAEPFLLGYGAYPSWSADSEWILFSANDIFKIRPDGTDLTQLTHFDVYFENPSWSPDEQWIVARQYNGLMRLPGDGSRWRYITNGNFIYPIWSPDGQWIASISIASPSNITIMHPNRSNRRDLINPRWLELHPEYNVVRTIDWTRKMQ